MSLRFHGSPATQASEGAAGARCASVETARPRGAEAQNYSDGGNGRTLTFFKRAEPRIWRPGCMPCIKSVDLASSVPSRPVEA